MTILVTGGAGYIGSHTCVELLNSGYEVVVIDNFSNSKQESLKRVAEITGRSFETYRINLLDKEKVRSVFSEHNIEAVIHFAGLKAVGESAVIPLQYYENNITGTVILCDVMREYGVKKLVFSSSATVYGATEQMPISEEAKLNAASPYGRTKQMIEEVLRDLYESDPTWGIALLRYFNPIGAHGSGRIGEDPYGIPNNLLPYISQVAVGKIQRLHVYGNDYPTKDGTGVRDYIHVVDLALGHLKALEKINNTAGVEAYNLGTGKGYSVLEMVDAFSKVSRKPIPYVIVDRREGDVATCYADPTKAKIELGWQASRSVDAMCADTWHWQYNNPNGYKETSINLSTPPSNY